MLRYTIARKPAPTEEDLEATVLGPTLMYVTTEPITGSPDTELLVGPPSLPFYRKSDAWGQQLINTWSETGLTTMEEFRDWLVTNYGSEYVVTLQVSGDDLSP